VQIDLLYLLRTSGDMKNATLVFIEGKTQASIQRNLRRSRKHCIFARESRQEYIMNVTLIVIVAVYYFVKV